MDVTVYVRAKITGSPSQFPNINVTLSAKGYMNTGGHTGKHTPDTPPSEKCGRFNPSSGKANLIYSNSSGISHYSFGSKYSAPEISGRFKLIAKAGGKLRTRNIRVKISGLVSLRDYNGSWQLVGETSQHPKKTNHYVTPGAANALVLLAQDWRDYWNGLTDAERAVYPSIEGRDRGTLMVNDCSLEWGGLFDITGQWVPSHHTHRAGLDTDIRSNERGGIPIDEPHKGEFVDFIDDNISQATVKLEYEGRYNEHYHINWDGIH